MRQSNNYYCSSKSGCCENDKREGSKCHNDTCNDKRNIRKSPPSATRGSSPVTCKGEQANYTFKEYQSNPHNQAGSKPCVNYNSECAHDNYFQDNYYASSNDELRGSNHTPMPRDSKASTRGGSKVVDESYHLSLAGKCPKKQRVTNVPIHSTEMILPSSLRDFLGMTSTGMMCSMMPTLPIFR